MQPRPKLLPARDDRPAPGPDGGREATPQVSEPATAGPEIGDPQGAGERPQLLHPGPSAIRTGVLEIDRDRYLVTVAGRSVHLTFLEFNVLWLIAELDGRVATYEALALALWGERTPQTRRRLAVVVSRMRSKLGEPGAGCIDTVTRVGYRLAAPLE